MFGNIHLESEHEFVLAENHSGSTSVAFNTMISFVTITYQMMGLHG